jgi:hypothetical protein
MLCVSFHESRSFFAASSAQIARRIFFSRVHRLLFRERLLNVTEAVSEIARVDLPKRDKSLGSIRCERPRSDLKMLGELRGSNRFFNVAVSTVHAETKAHF